jgi:hypothetical protein
MIMFAEKRGSLAFTAMLTRTLAATTAAAAIIRIAISHLQLES